MVLIRTAKVDYDYLKYTHVHIHIHTKAFYALSLMYLSEPVADIYLITNMIPTAVQHGAEPGVI